MKYSEKVFHAVVLSCTLGFYSAVAFSNQVMVTGTVTQVIENYRTLEINHPRQECRTVEVPVVKQKQAGDNIGTFVLGAIIGSAIGNAATDGNGAGTAGAILGGTIANEHQKKHNTQQEVVGYRQVQQCNTVYDKEVKSVVQDYTVTYSAMGQSLTTRTKEQFAVGQPINVFVKFSLQY